MEKQELIEMLKSLEGCNCTPNDACYNRGIRVCVSLVEAYAKD